MHIYHLVITPLFFATVHAVPAPQPFSHVIAPIKALAVPTLPTYQPMALQALAYSPPGTYANPYPAGQCTALVASMKGNIPVWGDAQFWDDNARAAGITVSDTPIVGSVGVERAGNHVVLVTSVNDGTVTVEEGNYDYQGSIRSHVYPIGSFNYLYL